MGIKDERVGFIYNKFEMYSELNCEEDFFKGDYENDENMRTYLSSFDDPNIIDIDIFSLNDLPRLNDNHPEIQNQPIQTPQNPPKDKLDYHNFQKHLVITLRDNINSSLFTHHSSESQIEFQLWTAFCKSRKMTKELIELTFGGADKKGKVNLEKYGFNQIYGEFPKEKIQMARMRIQQEVLRQIKELDLECLIEERRIKYKDNFRNYMLAFIEGLENGKFFKRLPAMKKRKAQQA